MDWDQIIESETLEAKRQLPSSSKLAIEVVAFANTRGGRIVNRMTEENQKNLHGKASVS